MKGMSERNTLNGRAMNIINTPTSKATRAVFHISLGSTSKPSNRNIPICIIQVIPSQNATTCLRFVILRLPTIIPVMYTAR